MVKFLPTFNEKNPDVFFSLFGKISEERACEEASIALSKPERRDYAIVLTHRSNNDGEIMGFNLLTQNLIKIEKKKKCIYLFKTKNVFIYL